TGVLEPGYPGVPGLEDFLVGPIHAVFARNADFLALEVCIQRGRPFGHRLVEAGRILRVEARHRLEHDRAVLDRARHWAGLVERTGERHHAPAGAAPIGRLDAGDAGERRRLSDRAAGVGPGRRRAQPRGHGRRAAARGTARRQNRIVAAAAPPRAGDVAEIAGLVRRTH